MMRRTILCLVAFAVGFAPVARHKQSAAQAPKVERLALVASAAIEGPKEKATGKSCVYRIVNLPAGVKPKWEVIPDVDEFVTSRDDEGVPQGFLLDPDDGTYFIRAYFIEGGEIRLLKFETLVGPPLPPPVPPGPPTPDPPPGPIVPPNTKVTAATYVYEKDDHPIPPAVMSALNRLNRERSILATVLDDDTTDGSGQVPEQYKIAVTEARKAGLPTLVVQAGSVVLRVVKDPKTESAVMEAAQ